MNVNVVQVLTDHNVVMVSHVAIQLSVEFRRPMIFLEILAV